jgi:hypothetical protein
MKINKRSQRIVIVIGVLLTVALTGCSHSQPETVNGTGAPAPTASNLTPQQQAGARTSAQHDGEMRAAAARQQSTPGAH